MENGRPLSPLNELEEHIQTEKIIDKENNNIAGKSFVEFFKDAKPPNENVNILDKVENREHHQIKKDVTDAEDGKRSSLDNITDLADPQNKLSHNNDKENSELGTDAKENLKYSEETSKSTIEKREAKDVTDKRNIGSYVQNEDTTNADYQLDKSSPHEKYLETDMSHESGALAKSPRESSNDSLHSTGKNIEAAQLGQTAVTESPGRQGKENEDKNNAKHEKHNMSGNFMNTPEPDSQIYPEQGQISEQNNETDKEIEKDEFDAYGHTTVDHAFRTESKQSEASKENERIDVITNAVEKVVTKEQKQKQDNKQSNDSEKEKPQRSGLSPPLISISKPDEQLPSPGSKTSLSDHATTPVNDNKDGNEMDKQGNDKANISSNHTRQEHSEEFMNYRNIYTSNDTKDNIEDHEISVESDKATKLPRQSPRNDQKGIQSISTNESVTPTIIAMPSENNADRHIKVDHAFLTETTELEDSNENQSTNVMTNAVDTTVEKEEKQGNESSYDSEKETPQRSGLSPPFIRMNKPDDQLPSPNSKTSVSPYKTTTPVNDNNGETELDKQGEDMNHARQENSEEIVNYMNSYTSKYGAKEMEDHEISVESDKATKIPRQSPSNDQKSIQNTSTKESVTTSIIARTSENNEEKIESVHSENEDGNLKTNMDNEIKEVKKEKIHTLATNVEHSHSMYFTGRLPTMDPPETISPRLGDNKEKEGKTNDHGSSLEDRIHHPEDDHQEIESESKPSRPGSGTKETTPERNEGTSNRMSTPSRDIETLIQEIKAPIPAYGLSREKSLTPTKEFKEEGQTMSIQKESTSESVKNDRIDVEGKHVTVRDLNSVTSGIMKKDYESSSVAKYDDLPHMKKILEYTAESGNRTETAEQHEHVREKGTDTRFTRTVTDLSDIEHASNAHREDASPNYEIEQTAMANRHEIETEHQLFKQKTSHSESDLKEMIASAKMAIGEDESMTDVTSMANTAGKTSSREAWKTDDSTNGNTYDGLICSSCLCIDSDFVNAGFCHDCQEYLCGKCKNLHKQASATAYHHVMDSYCTNELKTRKYIRATGYCNDCGIFLCGKCTVQHTGFRAFRRHKIIQSSFISRQAQSQSTESTVSLNNTKEAEIGDETQNMKEREKENQEKRRRKKYLNNLETNNRYGFNFTKVPETLYPGPRKKLTESYTRNPHWSYSSIPTLPYLVKPGNLEQRALKAPYLQAYKTPFYTQTKRAFDPNAIKMTALQARYNVNPERKHFRRREAGLFIARPLRNAEGISLPDITSARSYDMTSRYSHLPRIVGSNPVRRKPPQHANKLKRTEYVRDQCLSIPFPSNELPCLISDMEVLQDGRLVVLDKRNNNIKLFSRKFLCKASLQFQNKIIDICASNICPTDIYAATTKYVYEVSLEKGMQIVRKMKVEIKRIEGLACWKYGIGVISLKNSLAWEVRLLDYRGNLKSKLEVLNPLTCDIESSFRYHVVPTKAGKYLTIADAKNACTICVDVTTRCIVAETSMRENKKPSYLTSDHQGNVYVSCGDEVQQVSPKGRNLGVVVKIPGGTTGNIGCIVYNTVSDRLYVQIKSDIIAIYKMNV